MNCEGSSTASHSTLLMPAASPCGTSVSMCCSPCPNSWKSVSTSPKVMRLGASPPPPAPLMGGEPLHVRYAVGVRPSARLRPTHTSIHAPPRFSAGREYGSRKKLATTGPSLDPSRTSK